MALVTRQKVASGISASSNYSLSFDILNTFEYSVQVVWTGVDSDSGTFQISDSNDGENFNPLVNAQTMACACTSMKFNFYDSIGYSSLCEYTANNNTAGSFDIEVVKR